MPEGDSIHYAAKRIAAVLGGTVPERIATPHPRIAAGEWPRRLAGREVHAVDALGKHLFIRFDGGLTLHSHLRMTGAWHIYGPGERWRRSPRGAWLLLTRDGTEVVQFGGPLLELIPDSRARTDPRLAELGQDVIGESFNAEEFLHRLRADDPRRPFGDALLEQRTIAGIGNIWKSESCHAARLDPWREQAAVGDEQALAAVRFARVEMARCVREGTAARPRAVYRRTGQRCRRCGERIRSRGQGEGNRITYWCPGCQR
jgi:endonuclease-8